MESEVGGLVAFAQKELDLILDQVKQDRDEEDIRMQEVFNKGIMDVVKAFSDCGHSGFTASMAIRYLERLLRYRPLLPLTLEDDEWVQVEGEIYQNKRASNVFKQPDKFDGKPYCIDGPEGQCVTLEEYPLCYVGIFTKREDMEEA